MSYHGEMAEFGMHEAKTHLSKLVQRAREGEEIVITRSGEPMARLVPVVKPKGFAALLGIYEGQVWMADDFDDYGPELAEMFGTEPDPPKRPLLGPDEHHDDDAR